MNPYYSFNDFMSLVMARADELSRQRHDRGLEELFDVSRATFDAATKLIKAGWYVFIAVTVLTACGLFSFMASLLLFLTTPVGLIVGAIFGVTTIATLKIMYDEKILPNAVKEVGEEFKSRWEVADGTHSIVDRLTKEAAESLYLRAADRAQHMGIIYRAISS